MNFYSNCDTFLSDLADKIEAKDKSSLLEVEYHDGILEIKILSANKTFVINRNSGNQKIWYSSPFSGADYFSFDEKLSKWLDLERKELSEKLFSELENIIK